MFRARLHLPVTGEAAPAGGGSIPKIESEASNQKPVVKPVQQSPEMSALSFRRTLASEPLSGQAHRKALLPRDRTGHQSGLLDSVKASVVASTSGVQSAAIPSVKIESKIDEPGSTLKTEQTSDSKKVTIPRLSSQVTRKLVLPRRKPSTGESPALTSNIDEKSKPPHGAATQTSAVSGIAPLLVSVDPAGRTMLPPKVSRERPAVAVSQTTSGIHRPVSKGLRIPPVVSGGSQPSRLITAKPQGLPEIRQKKPLPLPVGIVAAHSSIVRNTSHSVACATSVSGLSETRGQQVQQGSEQMRNKGRAASELRDPRLAKFAIATITTTTTAAVSTAELSAVAPPVVSVAGKALRTDKKVPRTDNKVKAQQGNLIVLTGTGIDQEPQLSSNRRLSPVSLKDLGPSLEAAAAVMDSLSLLTKIGNRAGILPPPVSKPAAGAGQIVVESAPISSCAPTGAVPVAPAPQAKPGRLLLPTPVPACTPDSDHGPSVPVPALRGLSAAAGVSANLKAAAGRQKYNESMDQGPGKQLQFFPNLTNLD
jgi:hypothetical protein